MYKSLIFTAAFTLALISLSSSARAQVTYLSADSGTTDTMLNNEPLPANYSVGSQYANAIGSQHTNMSGTAYNSYGALSLPYAGIGSFVAANGSGAAAFYSSYAMPAFGSAYANPGNLNQIPGVPNTGSAASDTQLNTQPLAPSVVGSGIQCPNDGLDTTLNNEPFPFIESICQQLRNGVRNSGDISVDMRNLNLNLDPLGLYNATGQPASLNTTVIPAHLIKVDRNGNLYISDSALQ